MLDDGSTVGWAMHCASKGNPVPHGDPLGFGTLTFLVPFYLSGYSFSLFWLNLRGGCHLGSANVSDIMSFHQL